MIVPPVLAEERRPAALFDEHYAAKYRHPLRKLATFGLIEGPGATLRKTRSKLLERRIERAQELVIAAIQGARRPLLALTRDLGGALAFDPALVFAARDGAAEPARMALPDRARVLLEGYLPVPACPLAGALREEILTANPWLEAVAEDDLRGLALLGETARTLEPPGHPSAVDGGHVYLIGCGGYVREQVLPHFRGLVAGAVDHKSGLILRYVAPPFPVWAELDRLLQAIAGEAAPLVIVSSYHSDHGAHARAVLEANPRARVFLEKPPVTHAEDARALAARRAAGAWIDVGYNRRYAPLTSALRRELTDRSRPWLIAMRVRELRLPASHWYHWSNQGTRITGNLCHWLDLAVHLVSETVREVSVVVGSGGEAVDIAFADGSIASISSTDRGDDLAGVSERIEIFAADRTAVLDDFRRLTILSEGRRRRLGGVRREKGHRAMYASLRERWRSGGRPLYPEDDLVNVAELVERSASLYAAGGGRARLETPA